MEKKRKQWKNKNKSGKTNKHRKAGSDDDEGFEEVKTDLNLGGDVLTFHDDAADMGMDSDSELTDMTRKLVQQQNRKNKKSGGFQAMGLSHGVYKGVFNKGYKMPTPIQRKTIPLIMEGKDVVAMARTGSGKTAAFLIPMFEKLKAHSAQSGCRAIILSPTRELAVQTCKFTKEIGKYTGLKAAVILGGDSIEDQFAALHENPDVIIATPGRFMHVLVEMELKLSAIEYIVFDEADRLFEMGFQEQLEEILSRVPENRQTLLFSATLPKLLVEFAKAGLHDPTLVRLDVDTKLSDQLKLAYLHVRHEDRLAALLHLLRNVVKPSEQTVLFVATKHHVEYLNMVLQEAGMTCSYTYSSLDATARKIQVAKFRNGKTKILIVTDLAARGIDIPMLDNVINFNFPAKPKLFVHRVGRVARAGRSGTAYSLVSVDEMPYVLDLHLFLGRPFKMVNLNSQTDEDGLIGRVPQSVLDDEDEHLRVWNKKTDLMTMRKVIDNAYKHYLRSRPAPSSESVKRYKATTATTLGYHPLFAKSASYAPDLESSKEDLMERMRNYKPQSTIFEIAATKKGTAAGIMQKKRDYHGNKIAMKQEKKRASDVATTSSDQFVHHTSQTLSTEEDIENAFSHVVAPKLQEHKQTKKERRKNIKIVDEENFLSGRPKDNHSEKYLSLGTSFDMEADKLTLDLAGDDNQKAKSMNNAMKWDRKKKKFVREDNNEGKNKKVRTESGRLIKASYKNNLYKDWLDKNKVRTKPTSADSDDDDNNDGSSGPAKKKARMAPREGRLQMYGEAQQRGRGFHQTKQRPDPASKGAQPRKRELKSKDQILKQRRKKAKLQNFQKHQHTKRQQKKGGHGGGNNRRKK